jgi:hypothetical protein
MEEEGTFYYPKPEDFEYKNPQVEYEKEIQKKYKLVFLSVEGRQVLGDILFLCHFGRTLNPDNKTQIAEYNVGVSILGRIGILSEDSLNDVVNAICNITPKIKEVEG